jgi:hypothetical protein
MYFNTFFKVKNAKISPKQNRFNKKKSFVLFVRFRPFELNIFIYSTKRKNKDTGGLLDRMTLVSNRCYQNWLRFGTRLSLLDLHNVKKKTHEHEQNVKHIATGPTFKNAQVTAFISGRRSFYFCSF